MDSQHFLAKPAVYKCGLTFSRYVPSFILGAIADRLAEVSYLIYKKEKTNVRANLRRVFPDAPQAEINRISFSIFKNYGRYLCDYGKFIGGDKSFINRKFTAMDGEGNLRKALQMKKGLILLTAHLGNWELGGTFFGRNNMKTNVITLRDQNADIDFFRTWYRKIHNVNTISIGDSPFSSIDLISAIKNNEVIAMLIDRYENKHDSMMMDFFNKPTPFPRGPFILGRLTGAPVVAAFVIKEKKGYRGIVEEPFILTKESEEIETLKKVVKILEKYIIMYPTQWYNFV